MTFPNLLTKRLALREITEADTEDLLAIFTSGNVLQYYGMEPLKDAGEAKLLALRFKEGWRNRTSIRWGMQFDGKLCGTIGFHNWNSYHKRAEIGYEIHPDYWRFGLTFEALTSAADFGFSELGLNRIGAVVRPENTPSLRLLEKAGFEKEGVMKKAQYSKGLFYDLVLMGKISD
ncbi:GNAT family N-acetyltransferase [Metabacillus sp. 84]|uniref:GNAT family N-acetyltransferase n=1 Tax=Metabacillus sp. 84 TaxID=3404705 RepID=UPI003CEDB728